LTRLREINVAPESPARFGELIGEAAIGEARAVARAARERWDGRAIWNVNSTARGGGVAELLQSLLAYARGFGLDARWLVLDAPPPFFRVTKRLHHALHGSSGDGSPLGEAERAVYEAVLAENARELLALVRPGDAVVLHDPQTAGLVRALKEAGALVIWRCHVGTDEANPEVERGWAFLAPYLEEADATVYSRSAFVPTCCHPERSVVIPPSIDAFSPKNQELDEATVRAILVHTGLVDGAPGDGQPAFLRQDGSPGRVDRRADVVRHGPTPAYETPLVVQVSRWDPLKDPIGVMRGFADLIGAEPSLTADLVLAGPNVGAVADDPEGAETFRQVEAVWRRLPPATRGRVHLASLPMEDAEENAAIVNALQRHAAIVLQKSLQEGFGLTVTEAMWKGRPVVASAVGGIRDQIVDGEHGLLLPDPRDLDAFAGLLHRLLVDPLEAERLGTNARERVRQHYLGIRHLMQYAELLARLDEARPARSAAAAD
jgi:trehalose synthase